MRYLPFVLALLLSATAARTDSPIDLLKPCSTIPGCVNNWGPFRAARVSLNRPARGKPRLLNGTSMLPQ
jgi:hypothetical protein